MTKEELVEKFRQAVQIGVKGVFRRHRRILGPEHDEETLENEAWLHIFRRFDTGRFDPDRPGAKSLAGRMAAECAFWIVERNMRRWKADADARVFHLIAHGWSRDMERALSGEHGRSGRADDVTSDAPDALEAMVFAEALSGANAIVRGKRVRIRGLGTRAMRTLTGSELEALGEKVRARLAG